MRRSLAEGWNLGQCTWGYSGSPEVRCRNDVGQMFGDGENVQSACDHGCTAHGTVLKKVEVSQSICKCELLGWRSRSTHSNLPVIDLGKECSGGLVQVLNRTSLPSCNLLLV